MAPTIASPQQAPKKLLEKMAAEQRADAAKTVTQRLAGAEGADAILVAVQPTALADQLKKPKGNGLGYA